MLWRNQWKKSADNSEHEHSDENDERKNLETTMLERNSKDT